MTNLTRLEKTLEAGVAHYNRECNGLRKNESSWGMYVVEPVLEVAGWPRRFEGGDGALFEYPEDKGADAALLAGGRVFAFGEFKGAEYGCRRDIRRHRGKFRELKTASVAFASWFDKGGGFAVYGVGDEDTLTPVEPKGVPSRKLAHLARPVLLSGQSVDEWASAAAESGELPQPRFSISAIRTRFFKRLFDHLALPHDRPFRHRAIIDLETEADQGTPSITFAHKDLYPALPKGWGITISIDPIRNIVTCNFFERSVRALNEYRCSMTFGRSLELSRVDAFVDGDVMKMVTVRKGEAQRRQA